MAPPSDPVAAEAAARLADALRRLAAEIEAGAGRREDVSRLRAEVARLEREIFGPRSRSGIGCGAKGRILAYLREHRGRDVTGQELAEVSGIQEWARRVRELRVEDGWDIVEIGRSRYRLEGDEPDAERAARWRTLNAIRRSPGAARQRIEALFESFVGEVVTREEIDYAARIKEGSRRVRELRDEHGWPIDSHIDEPGLRPGEYRLVSTNLEDRRDLAQRLYPEALRQHIFVRDHFTCQRCKGTREAALAQGDTRFYLELHHRVALADEIAAMPRVERDDPGNLVTLCHRCHVRETAELQRRKRTRRRPSQDAGDRA